MRRKRGVHGIGGTAMPNATTKKAAKRRVGIEEKKVEAREVKEERECAREFADEIIKAEEVMMGWNGWPCSWDIAVDEQMSWGTCWFPFWDMELIGEAYHALYSDVVWENDIWNFKNVKEVPSP